MKSLLCTVLILLFVCSISYGQDDDSGAKLKSFEGGKYTMEFSMVSNLFLGIGSRVGSMGGDLGGLFPSSESVLWNPANLCFIERSQWTLDVNPKIMLDPASFIDIDTEVHEAVDDGIEDLKGPDFEMLDENYPELELSTGMMGSFGTGSFAFVSPYGVFGGAIYKPFRLSMDLIGTGLEAQVKSGDEDSELAVEFFSTVDMSVKMDIHIQGWSIGAARQITPQWGMGMTIDRITGIADINGQFQVNGIMITSGIERAFNDPNDPWPNTLNSVMEGKYEGATTFFKLGTTYRLNYNWGIGAYASFGNELTMDGEMIIDQHTIDALTLEPEEGEDVLDPTDEKFNITEPTRTVKEENPTSDKIILNMPNSFGIGISGRMGFFGLSLNYIRYSGEFSYQYDIVRFADDDVEGNEEEVNYAQGIKLSNGFRLGLDFKIFRLGGGVMMGESFNNTDPEFEKSTVFVPSFSLGTGFRISQKLSVDLLLLGAPSGTGKISFNYQL